MTARKKPTAAKAAPKKAAPAKKPAATKKVSTPAGPSGMPALGKKAPSFSLISDSGETISLASLKGKAAVLYFYPKDDTPGCTTEALDFTALKKKFEAAGATVYGISKDSVEKHCKFRDKHGLSVTLLSDEEGKMLEAYGVWTEKSLYGRKFMGIVRSTVLLDDKGVVRQVWPKVRVKGHAEDVLAAVKEL